MKLNYLCVVTLTANKEPNKIYLMNGQELREHRKQLKIIQQHFANLLRVTSCTLSNWEIGRTAIPPHIEQLVKNFEEKLNKRRNS